MDQGDLFGDITDLDLFEWLVGDLHSGLKEKVYRSRLLTDMQGQMGASGTLIPGGETSWIIWNEARSSFIHGNFIATIVLCQGLAEHTLAAWLNLLSEKLPNRISFRDTLSRCVERNTIPRELASDLCKLMELRNPLSHYRGLDDPSNLTRRVVDSQVVAEEHLSSDASFAICAAVRLLSLPSFRIDGRQSGPWQTTNE